MNRQVSERGDIKELSKDFSVTPTLVNLVRPRRIMTSSSCRVIVRLPSVEPEEKIFTIKKKPLRPSSAPRVSSRSGGLKAKEEKEEEKGIDVEKKKMKKRNKGKFGLCSFKDIDSVFGLHVHNATPLPDLRVMEYKRASLRLRKLKRVAVRNDKENSLIN